MDLYNTLIPDLQLVLAKVIANLCPYTLVQMTLVCKHIRTHYYAVSDANYRRLANIPVGEGETQLDKSEFGPFCDDKRIRDELQNYQFSVFMVPPLFGGVLLRSSSNKKLFAGGTGKVPQIESLDYEIVQHGLTLNPNTYTEDMDFGHTVVKYKVEDCSAGAKFNRFEFTHYHEAWSITCGVEKRLSPITHLAYRTLGDSAFSCYFNADIFVTYKLR